MWWFLFFHEWWVLVTNHSCERRKYYITILVLLWCSTRLCRSDAKIFNRVKGKHDNIGRKVTRRKVSSLTWHSRPLNCDTNPSWFCIFFTRSKSYISHSPIASAILLLLNSAHPGPASSFKFKQKKFMGSETFIEVILAILLPPVGVFLRYGCEVINLNSSNKHQNFPYIYVICVCVLYG